MAPRRAKAKAKSKAKKPAPKAGVRKRPVHISVGDEVRVPVEVANQLRQGEQQWPPLDRTSEAVEGLVCAIRNIATGKLVPKTSGALEGFVLEVLHDRTFHPQFSSVRNTGGPRGPIEVHRNPNWMRVRGMLQQLAAGGKMITLSAAGAPPEALISLLDGWRVVKLRASVAELV